MQLRIAVINSDGMLSPTWKGQRVSKWVNADYRLELGSYCLQPIRPSKRWNQEFSS
jgi:hypothetical protein